MTLKVLDPERIEQIKQDLRTLGVSGSALLAIPELEQDADAHIYIREVVLAFLRSMFRTMPPGEYRWDPDPAQSEIDIHYADPRKSAEVSKRPAITVELAPFTYGQTSINDFLGGGPDGTSYYTAMRNGAVIIRCRSSVKLEADSLAHVVMGGLKYMHGELEKLAGFVYADAYMANPSSGELQQSNVLGEFFVANVVANIHYQETWKKSPERLVKGKVTFNPSPEGIYLD